MLPTIASYAIDKSYEDGYEKKIPLADFASVAEQKNAVICSDTENGARFEYTYHRGGQSKRHEVCGENAKNIAAKAKLLSENGFRGICIDGAFPFYAPLWLTIHSLFRIVKGNFGALR